MNDGGQWNMFVNIALKYGLVPKAAMPETLSSSATGSMNAPSVGRLRVGAKALRDMHGTSSRDEMRTAKEEILADVYRILRLHLGNPPESFDWQWTDDKKKFHREKGMTPKSFSKKYVTLPLEDYVCLVHDPRKSSPVGRTFTVEYLGNVVEGGIVTYLNVDIATMKEIALQDPEGGGARLVRMRLQQDDAPRPRRVGRAACSISRTSTAPRSSWSPRRTGSCTSAPP